MRLIVASNRLPFAVERRKDKGWEGHPGAGGLVTALRPVLQRHGGVWVGWLGARAPRGSALRRTLERAAGSVAYTLRPVDIPAADHDGFYRGFANGAIWPLFHDLPSLCRFRPEHYQAAKRAVGRFATAIAASKPGPEDLVWVHDYHLMGLGRAVRERRVVAKLAFFLHTPFPSADLFSKLPWRAEILRDLLEFDLIGVQTPHDRRNLLRCLHLMLGDVEVRARGSLASVRSGRREARIGAFPIGIDFHEFADQAASSAVGRAAAQIRSDEPNRHILLGVDRLDYTKGLPERLEAFAHALDCYPALRGQVTLVQFVVPSREDIPSYAAFKRDLERRVGEINGRFTRSGWVPVHYVFRSLDRSRLLAWYRASHVALVTPLKDGMNLVAKEYCASNPDGVLVLSEFAGAATQLQNGALLVNPHDVESTANAIERAVRMEPKERRNRMRRMRRTLRDRDVHWWLDTFLDAATAKGSTTAR